MRRFSLWLVLLFVPTASVANAQTLGSTGDYLHRGVTRYVKGDLDGAIADFDRVIENDPQAAFKDTGDSNAGSNKGGLKEVIVNRGRSLAIIPRIAAACYNRGLARKAKGDLDGAIDDRSSRLSDGP